MSPSNVSALLALQVPAGCHLKQKGLKILIKQKSKFQNHSSLALQTFSSACRWWVQPLPRLPCALRPSCRCADFQSSTVPPCLGLLKGRAEAVVLQVGERALPLHSCRFDLHSPHGLAHFLFSAKSSHRSEAFSVSVQSLVLMVPWAGVLLKKHYSSLP